MDEHYYAVIMAGGGGTRLWPLSRQERPKQMLPLVGSQSLYQDAVQRLDKLFPVERIFVVTIAQMAEELQQQTPEIPASNYLLEPQPKGTASVAGLAATVLQKMDPQAVIATLTSDHFIGNIDLFQQLLGAASQVAREGYLVTLGITPTFPATGYGYIQHGSSLGNYRTLEAFEVKQFKEKPILAAARRMLTQGSFTWNSGMFVWQVQTILHEIQHQMPTLYHQLQNIGASWHSDRQQQVLDEIWPQIEPNTIDYGVMEGAQHVAVIPAEGLAWNDVGSWDSLFDILPKDENGNILLPDPSIPALMLDTKNTLIQSEDSERLIVAIGLEDLVIVDTGKVLLVCRKEEAQEVRRAVDLLKKSHPDRV